MVRSLNVQCFVTVYTSHSASVTTRYVPLRLRRTCRSSREQQSVHEDPAAAQHAEEAQEAAAQRVLHRRLGGDCGRYLKRAP